MLRQISDVFEEHTKDILFNDLQNVISGSINCPHHIDY